jgi:ubiquinone/menaquinone biosynthesis C-methylase UbiE
MAAKLDYDRFASAYGPNRRTHPGVLAALVTTGQLGAASRVLEVGCGTGNYVAALADEVGCAVAGLDPSPAMLRQAAERAPWIPLHEGRAETLPFADGAFDLIFSVDVIHHVEDRLAFFREAFRVLAPGGSLCTATDSEDDIRRRVPLSSHFPETVAVELRRYPAIATLERRWRRRDSGRSARSGSSDPTC